MRVKHRLGRAVKPPKKNRECDIIIGIAILVRILTSKLAFNRVDVESQGEVSEVIKSSNGEHVFIVGTLDTIFELDSSSYEDAVRLAKPLKYGKNHCFLNMWAVPNDKLRVSNVGGVTRAFHLRKLVNLHDSDHYKIAVCAAPNNDVIMVQAPALDYEEREDLIIDMAEINVET